MPHGSDESLQWLRDKRIKYILYIPHGSDERAQVQKYPPALKHLYIPHGSDESLQYLRRCNVRYVLYIPHGSDERQLKTDITETKRAYFISHMVQMKAPITRDR